VQAEQGIQALKAAVDTLIIIPNEKLLEIADPNTPITEAFAMADEVLTSGVRGITELITTPGLINVDFADVKAVMADAGSAVMGIGVSTGDSRAQQAAEKAISSPLLETSMEGARGVLLSIAGPSDMSLHEVNTAASLISEHSDADANIIFGSVIDDALGDEIRVTVIAAGFDRDRRTSYSPPVAGPASGRGRPAGATEPDPGGPVVSHRTDEMDIPGFVQG
jgi:cell division protein FtsZ